MAKKKVEEQKPVDPENFSQAIRSILVELKDPKASASIVADKLSSLYPASAIVAQKTADKSFSVYVSGQREKAAIELGIPFEKGSKSTSVTSNQPVTLKVFASEDLDAESIEKAIKLIERCGGIDTAKQLSAKWAKMVEALGLENAKKAVEFI